MTLPSIKLAARDYLQSNTKVSSIRHMFLLQLSHYQRDCYTVRNFSDTTMTKKTVIGFYSHWTQQIQLSSTYPQYELTAVAQLMSTSESLELACYSLFTAKKIEVSWYFLAVLVYHQASYPSYATQTLAIASSSWTDSQR